MKKFLSLFLVFVLVMGTVTMLASCEIGTDKDKGNENEATTTVAGTTTAATTTVATTTAATTTAVTTVAPGPELPAGYKLYTGEVVSFAYPEAWELFDEEGMVMMEDEESGNNINLVSEPKTDMYDKLTLEQFNTEMKPFYEALGMSISDAVVDKKEIDGIKLTLLSYGMSVEGLSMKQTQYMFTVGELTYTITVTEMVSDAAIALNVLNSLSVKK